MPSSDNSRITRRKLLQRSAAAGAALSLPVSLSGPLLNAAAAATIRKPDSLPDPSVDAGTVNAAMPFDHIVVVMMENHSFDNLLGAVSRNGVPHADGLSFNAAGVPTNWNPGIASTGARVYSFPFASTAQGPDVTQTWNATHQQIDGGRMDGFVTSNQSS